MKALLGALAFVLLAIGCASAQPVSTFPQASTPLSGSEIQYIIQNGVSKQITVGNLATTVLPQTLAGQGTGPLTSDQAQLTVQLNNPAITANYLYRCLVSAACGASVFTDDAVRGIATNTAGTTNSDLITGLAGYFLNNAPASGGRAVNVGVGAYGVCAVNGSNCWGFDSIISDNLGLNISAGTGKGIYNEFDLAVTSASTIGGGMMLGGTWLVQPAGINGFAVNTVWGACGTGPCAPFAKWASGFIVQSGAASVGVNVGAANYTVTANVPSMPVYLEYYDGSATPQNVSLTALGGQLFLGGTAAAGFNVVNGGYTASVGNGYSVGTQAVASATATAAFIAPGSGFTSVQVGNGTASIALNGLATLKQYTVATLPPCSSGAANNLAVVSDATAPTYNGALTGGGAVHIPVFCNGTSWTAH